LNEAELETYRIFMENRARDEESGDKERDSETLTSPTLAPSHQSLFVADKMVEPTKPPA
jgi:hypothetical protein